MWAGTAKSGDLSGAGGSISKMAHSGSQWPDVSAPFHIVIQDTKEEDAVPSHAVTSVI